MKLQHLGHTVLIAVTLLLAWSCQKNDDFKTATIPSNTASSHEPQQRIASYSKTNQQSITKLGKALKNPYSVKNMQKAWNNLKHKNSQFKTQNINITTTHLYIKFKPKNENELAILQRDSTLTLYTYPLDYEIEKTGDYYHDPAVPKGQPTYQYCAVKANQQLPAGVAYQVLEHLFIPDEDGETQKYLLSENIINALVDEALKITGNLNETKTNNNLRRRRWTPEGHIRVYDHIVGDYVGISGIKVRARRWFTTHKGFTNTEGSFVCNGSFKRPANYSFKWERYEFSVRSGSFGQASYNGPKMTGHWDLYLGNSSSTTVNDSQQYYALIFQGAFDYYYGHRFGLTSPPTNSFLKRQLKIAARQKRGKSSYVKARSIWFGADISLQAWGIRADRVYGTTVHELAHAAHRRVDKNAYNDVVADAYTSPCVSAGGCDNLGPTGKNNRRLLETWARTVEIAITLDRYRNRFGLGTGGYDYGFFVNFQDYSIAANNYYTSAGWDMIDNVNQRVFYGDATYPIDRVSGYTITQLEQALKGAKSWWQWRDNIYKSYNNSTRNNLEELFNNWPN